jgi:hypothetical protein
MDIMELEKLFLALTRKTDAAFTQIHLVVKTTRQFTSPDRTPDVDHTTTG